jgi:uncharacterized protein with PIN domain
MAFSVNCTNKGCAKLQQPYIDPKTDKVYCSECDREISNLSQFAKNQMKSSKQFKQKTSTSFSVKCDKCNQDNRPKLVNNELVCPNCNKILDKLSLPFKNMLKERLKKPSDD